MGGPPGRQGQRRGGSQGAGNARARGMKALVTGGAGFIGCNLADRLATDGAEVVIFDALARPGVERNLAWLKGRHPARVTAIQADVRDVAAVREAARGVDVIFHLAAQVAVTTSLLDPPGDLHVNVLGTVNVLEAARKRHTPVIFASTNKVYGDLSDVPLTLEGDAYRPNDARLRSRGVDESRPLDFHTPYGCSKGAADQYVLDYARSFGVPGCVLRMSCVYGPHQMGTEDQGWVAHFLIRALQGQPIAIYGDGRQVRDILYVGDAVSAYLAAARRIREVAGRAFNLGGGPANAVSLLQLIRHIESLLRHKTPVAFMDWRAGDQRYYVSNTAAVRRDLGLAAPLDWRTGLGLLADWLKSEHRQSDVHRLTEAVS
ncbi:MAG TPA: SDR family NAD(P)-dependent oxidoreductase [Caulobacteraceae bacterium]|nr:SDR family NAD(P)-dependent oxidoreductase [Caulobacteraceae bacterium]